MSEERITHAVDTESWNPISPQLYAIMISKMSPLSTERIHYEWARTNWLNPHHQSSKGV